MTDKPPQNQSAETKARKAEREARRAEALRENLRRRKAQARSKADPPAKDQ